MKLKGIIETNNYIIKYSGINRSTRTRAGVIIWIVKSITNTVIDYTYWTERVREVKLNSGRGKLCFFLGLYAPEEGRVGENESTTVLQPATRAVLKLSRTKSPTHNELRTKRPM